MKKKRRIFCARIVAFVFVCAAMMSTACERSRKEAQEADLPRAIDPAWNDVRAIVRDVREVLPGLPSERIDVPGWPKVAAAVRKARLMLAGEGRLILAQGAQGLPSSIRVRLFLDDGEPAGGYLAVQGESGEPERWPIWSGARSGSREGDFTYVFRVSDPRNRMRYFALVGLLYGTGALRFRSFEGYLIFPGKGGSLAARPPLYPIDFGYHWPVPPRHEARLATLRQAHEALTGELTELGRLDASLAETGKAERALRSSAMPTEQEAKRQADLAALAGRHAELQRARAGQSDAIAAELERIYRLRAEIAGDWAAFRDSNPSRWMDADARQRSYAALQATADWRAGWRRAFDAIGGDARPALVTAREEMQRALLAEAEQKP